MRVYSGVEPPLTEAAMEVLLLLLDEIDDLVLMVRQRAEMLFD